MGRDSYRNKNYRFFGYTQKDILIILSIEKEVDSLQKRLNNIGYIENKLTIY